MRYVCGGCRERDKEMNVLRMVKKFVVPPEAEVRIENLKAELHDHDLAWEEDRRHVLRLEKEIVEADEERGQQIIEEHERRGRVSLLVREIAELARKSPWQNPTLNEIRQMIKKALEQ